ISPPRWKPGIARPAARWPRPRGSIWLRRSTNGSSVVQARIAVRLAALRSHVQHRPQRAELGSAARVLAGIGAVSGHLARPEVADGPVAAGEDVEAGDLVAVRQDAEVVARIVVVEIAVEAQVPPAALGLERLQFLHRRTGDHHQRNLLADVGAVAVDRTQQ